ncbi:aldo/keto reductase [Tropicimonas sp. IMCC6043]|uniref:aldo/keto reductase n=1 Tax=Tropicimonas sp. IMCC6043 TaxID=2510645 RepID=UPI00101B6BED|nr:aldo/keto reductase [Tropicimonas sp. IMCC6043]RYH11638.1 aldo/keto reductase [Tropicimonas sp. IMCC6043]
MRRTLLGTSDLEVSQFALGTMTFGSQTSEADAHRQIDMALDAGIDLVDTAEMYPVNPVRAETVGRTEEIIGRWIAASGRRGEIVLATKITGENGGTVRGGRGIHGDTMIEAVDSSLKRLQTDVIDVYQLHWPNRGSFHFRQHWDYVPGGGTKAEIEANIVEVLEAMTRLQREGKVRHFGLSNESTWGTAAWLRLAAEIGAPRMISIQNEYSMLCRQFDTDLAELAVREEVGLLAYSPLGTGLLTGKYRGGAVPPGSRMSINANLSGRANPRAHAAVEAYAAIAERHGLDLVHMSLAFCAARPFMGSVIFGATGVDQLEHILAGIGMTLSEEVRNEINAAHRDHPMPF